VARDAKQQKSEQIYMNLSNSFYNHLRDTLFSFFNAQNLGKNWNIPKGQYVFFTQHPKPSECPTAGPSLLETGKASG